MPVSFAEMKRGLAQIDADLLDCHSQVGLERLRTHWRETYTAQDWGADYRNLADEKFADHQHQLDGDAFTANHPLGAG